MTYKEKLRTREWKDFSENVKRIFDYKCQACCSEENLNVHHLRYYPGREPWDYDIPDVVVLCSTCHSINHDLRDILSEMLSAHRLIYPYDFEYLVMLVDKLISLDHSQLAIVYREIEKIKPIEF